MLHIVNKSPAQTTALASCLRFAKPGQALLLTEDATPALSPRLLATHATALAEPGDLASFPILATCFVIWRIK